MLILRAGHAVVGATDEDTVTAVVETVELAVVLWPSVDGKVLDEVETGGSEEGETEGETEGEVEGETEGETDEVKIGEIGVVGMVSCWFVVVKGLLVLGTAVLLLMVLGEALGLAVEVTIEVGTDEGPFVYFRLSKWHN